MRLRPRLLRGRVLPRGRTLCVAGAVAANCLTLPLATRAADDAAHEAAPAAPASVTIRRFEISGAQAVPVAELQQLLAPWLGKPATRADLSEAARSLERAYLSRWKRVARVSFPAQDVTDGVVRLQVTEARFGRLRLSAASAQAIGPERAAALMAAAQAPNALLRVDAVENATGLLNGWPGLSASSTLMPGDASGETDVALTLADRRPWDASARVDNEGARATGHGRLIVDASGVLPGGRGQTVGGTIVSTHGSQLLRLAGGMPVGDRGVRASLYASALDYRLVTPQFNSLEVKGPSNSVGGSVEWAVERLASGTTDASAQLERRRFRNEALGSTLSDYHVDALTLRAAQQRSEGRHVMTGDVSLALGRVDLAGSPNLQADALTARTAGRYAVLRATFARSQSFGSDQQGLLRLAGQVGSRNLDVSERLAIGGPQGVRAYPVGEAYGTHGVLASTEWQAGMARLGAPGLVLSAFADVARVRQLKNADFAGATPHNGLTLGGVGVWAEWRPLPAAALRLTVAQPVGGHPQPTADGNNQDGSRHGARAWASGQWTF